MKVDIKVVLKGEDNPALEYSDATNVDSLPPSAGNGEKAKDSEELSREDQEKFDNGIVPFGVVEDTRM